MARLKTYRVWYKDGSACLINETTHENAVIKATYGIRAIEKDNGTERNSKVWNNRTTVTKTECLSEADSSSVKWTAKEVECLVRKRNEEQAAYESTIGCDN